MCVHGPQSHADCLECYYAELLDRYGLPAPPSASVVLPNTERFGDNTQEDHTSVASTSAAETGTSAVMDGQPMETEAGEPSEEVPAQEVSNKRRRAPRSPRGEAKCRSCKKTSSKVINRGSHMVVTPCGHVFCLPCARRFKNQTRQESQTFQAPAKKKLSICPCCHRQISSKKIVQVYLEHYQTSHLVPGQLDLGF